MKKLFSIFVGLLFVSSFIGQPVFAQNAAAGKSVYEILKSDHEIVKSLFSQILSQRQKSDETFNQIKQALETHMKAEENNFYAVLADNPETRSMILEMYEEHNAAKDVMKQVPDAKDDAHWLAKVQVLNDMITNHIQKEEGKLFAKAQTIISNEQAQSIGSTIEKEELEIKK